MSKSLLVKRIMTKFGTHASHIAMLKQKDI